MAVSPGPSSSAPFVYTDNYNGESGMDKKIVLVTGASSGIG